MSGIFVSYRRDDSSGYATLIYDQLASRYGEANVFMDVDSLRPGIDYGSSIEDHVDTCDVLIALIGRQWLLAADSAGGRRLDDPEDWVRAEVSSALARDVRVIPVLVDGAAMPGAGELPEPLAPLARREALVLSNRHIRQDVGRLTEAIDEELTPRRAARLSRHLGRRPLIALSVLAAVLIAAAVIGLGGADDSRLRQFADGVDAILDQSAPSRQQISSLVSELLGGDAPTKDQRLRLENITANRSALVRAGRRLQAPTELARTAKSQLVAALDASLDFDRELDRCLGRTSRGARAACIETARQSSPASTAKDTFVQTYDEILASLGRGKASPAF